MARKTEKFLTVNGQTKSINEWSLETNLSYANIYMRMKAGWTDERTLSAPVRPKQAKSESTKTAEA